MTEEGAIQKKIVEYFKLLGYIVFRMNAGKGRYNQQLAPKGTPDLFVVGSMGRTFWIEVKTPSGALSDSQKKMHAKLRNMGQDVFVVDSLHKVVKYFEL